MLMDESFSSVWQGHRATNFVDGRMRSTSEVKPVLNPARLTEVVGEVTFAGVDLVDAAVQAAARAARGWAALTVEERIDRVRQAAAAVKTTHDLDRLAVLLTREQGKILTESKLEIGRVEGVIDYWSRTTKRVLTENAIEDHHGRRYSGYVPVGPVGIVTPWNWPVSLAVMKIIPALMAGNTVVIKPAPSATLTISAIVTAMAANLPPGVLNLVNGEAVVGAQLVAHPLIRKVVFTGSTQSGRKVYEACAPAIKNLTLELGGNDAAILLDDVIIDDDLVEALVRAAFITSGQVCWAIKRLYVPSERYDEVFEALSARVARMIVGNGLDPSVSIGPLHNAMQRGIVDDLLSDARSIGADVVTLGHLADGVEQENGHFLLPSLIRDIPDSASLVQREQFGPALPILRYDELENAIQSANSTEYGLCGSIWSPDSDRAFEVARQLEAGQIFVNCHGGAALDPECAFGGIKQSGLGREMGEEGLKTYLEPRFYSNRLVR
ncbi:aldehyde dehydrogenase family protein [Paraburkholderia sp. CNPSo 3076]|uniref:aldehyde dehydrogenase family protein n=1 Tax=Paraburkholderia sp. CNPSo 3076 TaxID=2940936 RepID=UPI002255BE48|nr:aldehyde dehydrogenase family protein [Paraburkholderia sp. CNPSo 3076]MCX5542109.1 aldehyde dehydrogenase family protein [Paraburkholderia sp. CNPSo 3076]